MIFAKYVGVKDETINPPDGTVTVNVDPDTHPPPFIPLQFILRFPVPPTDKLFVSCVTIVLPDVITTFEAFKFIFEDPLLNVVGKFPVLVVIPDALQINSLYP